ncbi:MAG: ATP synthase F1 subunit gamma [Deltaproteobacteria bacterium]|nr:ATP synthase F1 subunit gamma [Deltaproteobacteria bacterium]
MPESPREILRRIKGIKSTQQITKAMEMVAAVKLAKVRMQAENSRPYVDNMSLIMRSFCSTVEEFQHPLFAPRDEQNILLLLITSDRGLCGTFNTNVINAATAFIEEKHECNVSVITVGRKGNDVLSGQGHTVVKHYDAPWGEAVDQEVKNITAYLISAFESGTIDGIYILYSQFENVLRHVPTLVPYLPVPTLSEEEQTHLVKGGYFLVEPGIEDVAQMLVPRYLETRLYHSIIESSASEYAARMVSMRNANDNAEEVIADLTLTYNKARQASITRDLIDIIGGVEALRG